jgi:O-6-methylguanine DNA methyltransferase
MNPLSIKTTWGTIRLKPDGDAVTTCTLPFLKHTPRRPFEIHGFKSIEKLIAQFPETGLPEGTDFQRAVWRELKKIPRGQTRTYGEIARRIGRAGTARAVGSACGANPVPLFIPCHRAVAANGCLGGFSAGLPWKKLLLGLEGWSSGVLE